MLECSDVFCCGAKFQWFTFLSQEQAQALQQLLDKHAMPEDLSSAPSVAFARDIITYSHKICYTTFAPPRYRAGVTVLHNFRPPMPQERQLRASQLHAHRSEYRRYHCAKVAGLCKGLVRWGQSGQSGRVSAGVLRDAGLMLTAMAGGCREARQATITGGSCGRHIQWQ